MCQAEVSRPCGERFINLYHQTNSSKERKIAAMPDAEILREPTSLQSVSENRDVDRGKAPSSRQKHHEPERIDQRG